MSATSSTSSTSPDDVYPEVEAAVTYLLSHIFVIAPAGTSTHHAIHAQLCSTLSQRFSKHWWVEDPEKGSAYRSITRYGKNIDPILVRAVKAHCSSAEVNQLADVLLRSMKNDRWTLWIDPGCVSIRLFEGATTFDSGKTSAKSTFSGITEIWGKLPASLGGAHTSPGSTARSPHTPQKKLVTTSPSSLPASVTNEFLELISNSASPSKKSRAVAIVRPKSGHANVRHAEDARTNASTPPPPLPPLSFTIEESTSPYVPSFNNTPLGSALVFTRSRSSLNLAGVDRAITPLASSPLRAQSPLSAAIGSPSPIHHHSSSETISAHAALRATSPSATTPNGNNTGDPFMRPSSRSSTTSASSNASCSIFSHASNESRSSSIGSYTTMSSILADPMAAHKGDMQPSLGEMTQVKGFSFPNTITGAGGLSAPQASKSTPNSPSKTRMRAATASRHGHTLSTSSMASTTSSAPSETSRPGHSRGRSSQSNIRVSKAATQVQDYSNGKVGVLGGGVLLGLSSGTGGERKDSRKKSSGNTSRPTSAAGRPTSSSSAELQASTTGASASRPRSKSRTPSSSSSGSSNGTASGNHYAQNWYAHPHSHPHNHYQPPMPALPAQWR